MCVAGLQPAHEPEAAAPRVKASTGTLQVYAIELTRKLSQVKTEYIRSREPPAHSSSPVAAVGRSSGSSPAPQASNGQRAHHGGSGGAYGPPASVPAVSFASHYCGLPCQILPGCALALFQGFLQLCACLEPRQLLRGLLCVYI
jgi:hypothetical protein